MVIESNSEQNYSQITDSLLMADWYHWRQLSSISCLGILSNLKVALARLKFRLCVQLEPLKLSGEQWCYRSLSFVVVELRQNCWWKRAKCPQNLSLHCYSEKWRCYRYYAHSWWSSVEPSYFQLWKKSLPASPLKLWYDLLDYRWYYYTSCLLIYCRYNDYLPDTTPVIDWQLMVRYQGLSHLTH